jgi:peptidoglycan/xylan/chitin deacetylase (PgdA/CDA1 family)
VLRYHRVVPDGGPVPPLAVTESEFDAQLAFLKARCNVVRASEVVVGPPRGAVAITFDDGYRDNHDVALPILQNHGLTATFFVTTDWIGTERLLWWDGLHKYLAAAHATGATVAGGEALPQSVKQILADARLTSSEAVLATEAALSRALRDLDEPPEELDVRVEQIADVYGLDEVDPEGFLPMTWDHVRALREAGMDIGSHTRDHARLAIVPAERAHESLDGSKARIERELGESIDLLAYPAGSHDEDVQDLVAEAGYRCAFTTETGGVARHSHPLALPRVNVWHGGYRGIFTGFAPRVFGLQIARLARRDESTVPLDR